MIDAIAKERGVRHHAADVLGETDRCAGLVRSRSGDGAPDSSCSIVVGYVDALGLLLRSIELRGAFYQDAICFEGGWSGAR